MPAKPLNEHELKEAVHLKRLFASWQNKRKDQGLPSSQEEVAPLLGFGQSALSQYMNGKIPLNFEAAVSFARVMEVSIDDFSPTIASRIKGAISLVAGGESPSVLGGPPKWISQDAFRLLGLYSSCDVEAQVDLMETAAELSASRPRSGSIASNDD